MLQKFLTILLALVGLWMLLRSQRQIRNREQGAPRDMQRCRFRWGRSDRGQSPTAATQDVQPMIACERCGVYFVPKHGSLTCTDCIQKFSSE